MATKTQRVVAMSTPARQVKSRPGSSTYTAAEKASLLENFDLEVDDKTRAFKASLEASLTSFMLRKESEILKIPRDLRQMTLADLEANWGGSWAGTVQRIARRRIEEREKEEEEAREKARAEEEARGKRKRAEEASLEASTSRSTKNARREPTVPGSAKRPIPSSASKRRLAAKTPRGKALASSSNGPSGLPQDHIFNPLLPTTPGFPRRARRNESFFSANGSPIVIPSLDSPTTAEQGHDPISDDHHSDGLDPEDDLPDPEALEAQLLAQMESSPKSKSKPSSRKPKRAPSLMFRKSMAPGQSQPVQEGPAEMASIPLSDGRTVTFNPFDLSPGRIDAEMDEGGIGEQEKIRVKGKVKDAVFQALTSKMDKWKVF